MPHHNNGLLKPREIARSWGGNFKLSHVQINPSSSFSDLGFVIKLTSPHTAIQTQKTIPVRLKKGISGNQLSMAIESGMVIRPAVKAPAWVVPFQNMPIKNIAAIPGVNNP